jgi:hypothetical protein
LAKYPGFPFIKKASYILEFVEEDNTMKLQIPWILAALVLSVSVTLAQTASRHDVLLQRRESLQSEIATTSNSLKLSMLYREYVDVDEELDKLDRTQRKANTRQIEMPRLPLIQTVDVTQGNVLGRACRRSLWQWMRGRPATYSR